MSDDDGLRDSGSEEEQQQRRRTEDVDEDVEEEEEEEEDEGAESSEYDGSGSDGGGGGSRGGGRGSGSSGRGKKRSRQPVAPPAKKKSRRGDMSRYGLLCLCSSVRFHELIQTNSRTAAVRRDLPDCLLCFVRLTTSASVFPPVDTCIIGTGPES